MPWTHALTAAGLAVAAALGLPAQEAVPAASGSRLVLTLHSGESTSGRVQGSVVLECDPDGGSHPHPATACAALRAARGDLSAVRATRGVMCPMIYAPVTGEARGDWGGRTVRFTRTYGNRCSAAGESGGVFGF
ncbi:SSI family serine proteinase inhibitor [Peterkaempfera bronchialis]|uniref:Serine protease n=1 Tax=Peterkaempfera bronchialis TaxID=2126346 RepID=A0A345SRQ3_9ACTN|nr:SSI family serine proteinase inhibitor [Peterkaempfera bronchialis]AXI76408.1 serine protease [Peterkaempfera bronchialis]